MLERFVDYSRLLGCGIYILSLKGEVQYVGQSINLLKRLYTHHNTKWIVFDQVKVVHCERHELSRLEAHYIAKLEPTRNEKRPMPWPEKRVDLEALGLRVRMFKRRSFR